MRATCALALLLPLTGPARAVETRVAVVDLRRALAETEEGRKATSDLKRLFQSKQKELSERETELKKAAADLDRKRTLLSAEDVRKSEAELGGKLQALKQTFDSHQAELSRRQAEFLDGLQARMQRIVGAIADAEDLAIVIDRSQLLFVKPHLDLTNELIRRFNAGEAKTPKERQPTKR